MMRLPSDTEILLAETRLTQSKHDIDTSIVRLREELHTGLSKPAALVGVAGVAGGMGFLLARRFSSPTAKTASAHQQHNAPSAASTPAKSSVSIMQLIFPFVLRYSLQRLPQIASWLTKQNSEQAPARPNGHRYSPPPSDSLW